MSPLAIKKLREALNLTQLEFAVKVGTTPTTIHRWEAGVCSPSKVFARILLKIKIKSIT